MKALCARGETRWTCRPEKAMDCFLRTKMDVLVLGDVFVERVER